MAEEALRSTSPKANFYRLTRLLMRGGVNLLRETFDSIHSPADLHWRIADSAIQVQLRGARLTQPERALLYPSPGKYGESKDFDITLIFKLLRTICDLTPPEEGWDALPNDSDDSLVADLVRIKHYRNKIYGHRNSMEISDSEFLRLWEEISEVLLRIATDISPAKRDEWKKSIDDLRHKPLTPDEEKCIEELENWYTQDMDLKNQMKELREEMRSLNASVVDLLIHAHGRDQTAGSEPGAEQAAGADDPEPNNSPDIDVWNVILSFKESVGLFLRYLTDKLGLVLRKQVVRSWHITVECSSLQVLEGLWKDYCSGHLNSVAQKMLITQQVLEKLGLAELKLSTFISEDQYEKGKKLLEASSEGAVDKSEIQSVLQTTIIKALDKGPINPDLLTRILTLERENVALKKILKSNQGTFRSEEVMASGIERENMESGRSEGDKIDRSQESRRLKAGPFKVVMQPRCQEQKEGSRVEFKCNIPGEIEARYQWFKDDSAIHGQRNSSLVLDPVKVKDFGNYKCEVKYDDGDSEKCVTSLPAELDVIPSDGMKLKCLRDVDLDIREKVGNLLTKKRLGNPTWMQLADRYTMDGHRIVSLDLNQATAGKEVLDFLETSNPNLTVYDFCKVLKEGGIRRLDIADILSAHLCA